MNLFRVSLPARSRAAASRGEHNIRGGRTGGEGEPRGLRPEGVALIPFFSRVIQGVMLQCFGTQSAGANQPCGEYGGGGAHPILRALPETTPGATISTEESNVCKLDMSPSVSRI